MLMNHLVHSSDCQRKIRYWELSQIYISVTNDLYQMKALSCRQNTSQDAWCPLTWVQVHKADSFYFFSWSWVTGMKKLDTGNSSCPTLGDRPFLKHLPWRSFHILYKKETQYHIQMRTDDGHRKDGMSAVHFWVYLYSLDNFFYEVCIEAAGKKIYRCARVYSPGGTM